MTGHRSVGLGSCDAYCNTIGRDMWFRGEGANGYLATISLSPVRIVQQIVLHSGHRQNLVA
ncbi:MAG: hypothetical protein NVS3B5_18110 [Sphingomicrobium sp.]